MSGLEQAADELDYLAEQQDTATEYQRGIAAARRLDADILRAWPGQKGTAVYCGTQAHTYRMALEPGDPGERCVNCGWVRGGGSRQKVKR